MDYIIGAGAILQSGPNATITPATLHARVDPAIVSRAGAVAIDFEGTSPAAISKLLVLVQGSNAAAFRSSVADQLKARRDCSLADVFQALAAGAAATELHLFAHWFPDEATCSQLRDAGIEVVAHPVEAIEAAALVSGQRCRRWEAA